VGSNDGGKKKKRGGTLSFAGKAILLRIKKKDIEDGTTFSRGETHDSKSKWLV